MFECEFCKKSYSTMSSLQHHKKSTKKCIDIQRQLSLQKEKELPPIKTQTISDISTLENNIRLYKEINQDLNLRLYEMQQMHEQEVRTLNILNHKYKYENNVLQTKLETITKQYEELIYDFDQHNDCYHNDCYHNDETIPLFTQEDNYIQTMIDYSWKVNKQMHHNLKQMVEDRTKLLSLYIPRNNFINQY